MGRNYVILAACPSCGKDGVEVLKTPGYLGHKVSRISAGAHTRVFNVPESAKLMSGCKLCGKTLTELRAIEQDGHVSHEERIRRLQDGGIPTRVVSDS